jgi:hypothetical protein
MEQTSKDSNLLLSGPKLLTISCTLRWKLVGSVNLRESSIVAVINLKIPQFMKSTPMASLANRTVSLLNVMNAVKRILEYS